MTAVSPTLLGIVAEAASAYRTGSDVYVAAQLDYPHDREVFYTYDGSSDPRANAESFLAGREEPEAWQIFGPYVTEREEPASAWTALNYRITIQVRSPTGEESEVLIDWEDEMDAVFLTLPAWDKFVVPYYTRLLGAERALEIRREFIGRPGPHGHVWNTKTLPV